jgi:hypothetical protein
MINNVYRSSYKVTVILVRFDGKLISPDKYLKNTQIPDFMKICSVETDLFHVDRQMDRRKDRHT